MAKALRWKGMGVLIVVLLSVCGVLFRREITAWFYCWRLRSEDADSRASAATQLGMLRVPWTLSCLLRAECDPSEGSPEPLRGFDLEHTQGVDGWGDAGPVMAAILQMPSDCLSTLLPAAAGLPPCEKGLAVLIAAHAEVVRGHEALLAGFLTNGGEEVGVRVLSAYALETAGVVGADCLVQCVKRMEATGPEAFLNTWRNPYSDALAFAACAALRLVSHQSGSAPLGKPSRMVAPLTWRSSDRREHLSCSLDDHFFLLQRKTTR